LFFGLFEELRCGELTVLEWNDVTELEMQNALLITVLTSKTDKAGESFEFIISSNLEHPEICSVRLSFRYKALFPSSTGEKLLFHCLSIILFLTTFIVLSIIPSMNTFRTLMDNISRGSIYRFSFRKKYN